VKYVERLSHWCKEERHIPGDMVQQIMALARNNPIATAAVVKLVRICEGVY